MRRRRRLRESPTALLSSTRPSTARAMARRASGPFLSVCDRHTASGRVRRARQEDRGAFVFSVARGGARVLHGRVRAAFWGATTSHTHTAGVPTAHPHLARTWRRRAVGRRRRVEGHPFKERERRRWALRSLSLSVRGERKRGRARGGVCGQARTREAAVCACVCVASRDEQRSEKRAPLLSLPTLASRPGRVLERQPPLASFRRPSQGTPRPRPACSSFHPSCQAQVFSRPV